MSHREDISGVTKKKLIHVSFEKKLSDMSKSVTSSAPHCFIGYCWDKDAKVALVHKIENHLRLAGINTYIDHRDGQHSITSHMRLIESDNIDYVVYGMSIALINRLTSENGITGVGLEIPMLISRASTHPGTIIPLLLDGDLENSIPAALKDISYIDFRKEEDYYLSFFEIIKRLRASENINGYVTDFLNQQEAINDPSFRLPSKKRVAIEKLTEENQELTKLAILETTEILLKKTTNELKNRKRRMPLFSTYKLNSFLSKIIVLLLFICGLAVVPVGLNFLGYFPYSTLKFGSSEKRPVFEGIVRPEFPLPEGGRLLQRPNIIAEIDGKLKGNDIQTVALTGVGGSGKTTLARQFANSRNYRIVWEINAETKDKLISSYVDLAHALAFTSQEKRDLWEILPISTPKQRDLKLLTFIKDRLKSIGDWLLIYDNVENFSDVSEYFPNNSKVWGRGSVLITTRNKNIAFANYVNIGSLKKDEKEKLFFSILSQKKNAKALKVKNVETYLKDIPSFPLDITLAAYYIKGTRINPEEYLTLLREDNEYFDNVQHVMMKDMGSYDKTRHSIIKTSVSKISDDYADFKDLLILVSVLDARNIPVDVMKDLKNPVIVDNFIYNLQKYSLLEEDLKDLSGKSISFHRVMHGYIAKIELSQVNEKSKELVSSIGHILLKRLIEGTSKHDIEGLRVLKKHVVSFLGYRHLIEKKLAASLLIYLGNVYKLIGDLTQAEILVREGLEIFRKEHDQKGLALALEYLGSVYNCRGDYKQAEKYLSESVYASSALKNTELAEKLGFLGGVYFNKGQYKKAQDVFHRSLEIYKRKMDWLKFSWITGSLGQIYIYEGKYEKAQRLFKECFEKYNAADSKMGEAWSRGYLGILLYFKNQYQESRKTLEGVIEFYIKTYGKNHIKLAWLYRALGATLIQCGETDEAIKLLRHSQEIFTENYSAEHYELGLVLYHLGIAYLSKGQFREAEKVMQTSLKIFSLNAHPLKFWPLYGLACLYKKISVTFPEKEKQYTKEYSRYKSEALEAMKKLNFSDESVLEIFKE